MAGWRVRVVDDSGIEVKAGTTFWVVLPRGLRFFALPLGATASRYASLRGSCRPPFRSKKSDEKSLPALLGFALGVGFMPRFSIAPCSRLLAFPHALAPGFRRPTRRGAASGYIARTTAAAPPPTRRPASMPNVRCAPSLASALNELLFVAAVIRAVRLWLSTSASLLGVTSGKGERECDCCDKCDCCFHFGCLFLWLLSVYLKSRA